MTPKAFTKQLLLIFVAVLGLILLTLLWLRFYTNHGQQLDLPDYSDMPVNAAIDDADDKSFEIVVNDSVHIVGRQGGIIIDQNPKGGSKVKENRKIYVTITKFRPDVLKFGDLPTLYGNDYDQKRRELKYLEINTVVDEYKYDPGEPNHILEVRYNGEVVANRNIEKQDVEIEKGSTLHFVLSQRSGGQTTIPDLRCYTVAQARFYLEQIKLKLGDITPGIDSDEESTYITSQDPPYTAGETIDMGSPIHVRVMTEKPDGCN